MKLVKPCLAAALLLVLASAAGAADAPAADLQPPATAVSPDPAETIEVDDLFAATDDCAAGEPAQGTLVALDGPEELQLATQYCGACSQPICQGAARGQHCGWDSGGAKHCNIFSGGWMCPTGWWECQCQSGPLP